MLEPLEPTRKRVSERNNCILTKSNEIITKAIQIKQSVTQKAHIGDRGGSLMASKAKKCQEKRKESR